MKTSIKTQYVDIETGEVLRPDQVEKKYLKIKCKKTTKKVGWYLQITYIWVCKINNQLNLEL